MGAVKSQPGLGAPDRLSARYGGVPVIYVESEDDGYVFGECWFKDKLSHVEFRSASTQCGISGCNAVIRAVGEERKAGNPAWGIVDRDAVMSQDKWELVHEIDDEVFERAKPFGPQIKVLRRWEMESYLIEGEVLEKCRAEIKMDVARPAQDVHQELFDHCQALVPHAAVNALFHTHKVSGLKDIYANCARFMTRASVEMDIQGNQLPRLGTDLPAYATEYRQHVSNVDAFEVLDANLVDRVNSLLRRIHGKELLSRYMSSHKIHNELKGQLANRIKELGRVPEEIIAFVDMAAATV